LGVGSYEWKVGMAVKSYRELVAWQQAMELVVEVYRLVHKFPAHELYGLTSQLRREAVSVASNIAEGQGRGIGHEFAHHGGSAAALSRRWRHN
jgi:hypothetical protein